MNIQAHVRRIEKKLETSHLMTKVHFFKNHEEANTAEGNKEIGKNDIVFIEDVPLYD